MGLFSNSSAKDKDAKRRSMSGTSTSATPPVRAGSLSARAGGLNQPLVPPTASPTSTTKLREARQHFEMAQKAEVEARKAVDTAERRLQSAQDELKRCCKAIEDLDAEARAEAAAAEAKSREATELRKLTAEMGKY